MIATECRGLARTPDQSAWDTEFGADYGTLFETRWQGTGGGSTDPTVVPLGSIMERQPGVHGVVVGNDGLGHCGFWAVADLCNSDAFSGHLATCGCAADHPAGKAGTYAMCRDNFSPPGTTRAVSTILLRELRHALRRAVEAPGHVDLEDIKFGEAVQRIAKVRAVAPQCTAH